MSLNSIWFKNGQPSKLNLPTWTLAIIESVGVQRSNVPHFKGLIMLCLDFETQGRDSTFTFCHAHLKKAILLFKMANVRFDLNTAVICKNWYFYI